MFESGQLNPEELAKVAGASMSPQLMGQLFEQVRAMMSDSTGPVNWELATKTATDLATKEQREASSNLTGELQKAFEMAALWLSEVTEFANSETPKQLTRKLWVQDSIPLFRELAEPVATSMSKALSENLRGTVPEELAGMIGPASKFLQNAGAVMFAAQLGQAVGKLSQNVLSSTEIGLPLSSRPGFVTQNLEAFLSELEVQKSEMLIFLCIRELATSALYASNRWLREQLITQVREFAAGLRVDLSSIQELAAQVDPSDPSTFQSVIESGALITPRTQEQETALERIELLLALVEGWADAVSLQAASRLPSHGALMEVLRRHQAVGAAQKTFATLLGLELKPRLQRESMAMWQQVRLSLPLAKADSLWSHPDQLPNAQEIQNPELLISRINGSDDDLDQELRNLLG
ncbi:zinc-dependent metalloprotease [Aquiluna borgnonia]|uniref:Zinc-dependent metalloprotease n=1 Tax=Aquiluna borgnonia TaxID=2499157 RepID=A0A7D4QN88_9MICO|nr:zinc-dependent metalloprotease [Aquiluna borgnonia]QKJ25527.1 zinc-dependent metalloprotease [Aquiluna borgnonia]